MRSVDEAEYDCREIPSDLVVGALPGPSGAH